MGKNKNAFTIIEVIIVIGIIGIVAAITISALGLNVSSKKFQTQLKKSLSTLDQAAISAQARYYTDYSSLSTESNDSTCSSDKLASGNQTMCALFNTTLSAKSYLGVYGTSVRSFIGLGLYRINTQTINPDGYLVYSLSDGSFVGFNPKAKNCSLGAGTSLTEELLTEGNLSDCLGFIDVNGASLPNREVLCSEGETVLEPLSSCKVKNVNGDVFPVVFHDGRVEFASNAARSAFFGDRVARILSEEELEAMRLAKRRNFSKWEAKTISKGLTKAECEALPASYGIKDCFYNDDRWAAAAAACGGVDKVASDDDLWELAKTIYTNCNKNSKVCSTGDHSVSILDSSKVPPGLAGLGTSWEFLWSGSENNPYYASPRQFTNSYTIKATAPRYHSLSKVVCVGDL